MTVLAHKAFAVLPKETRLWRYIDLSKLIHLLSTGSLWMCRSDLLGDPFEGSTPEPDVRQREREFTTLIVAGMDGSKIVGSLRRTGRKRTFINCWHMGEHESAAMWRLYLKSDEGVAIQSTVGKLWASIRSDSADEQIVLGQVEYIDFGQPWGQNDSLYLIKRKSFEHEREIRLVREDPMGDPSDESPSGVALPCDLAAMIEGIRVPPTCEKWFCDVVQATVKQFAATSGVNLTVQKSDLAKDPVF
jgi:hypothetical protein